MTWKDQDTIIVTSGSGFGLETYIIIIDINNLASSSVARMTYTKSMAMRVGLYT
jgi:hypothetical protein